MHPKEPTQGISMVVKLVFALPIAAVALLMIASTWSERSPEGKAKTEARTAIEQCWKDQESKTPESGSSGPAVSACQTLEFDFKTRFSENP